MSGARGILWEAPIEWLFHHSTPVYSLVVLWEKPVQAIVNLVVQLINGNNFWGVEVLEEGSNQGLLLDEQSHICCGNTYTTITLVSEFGELGERTVTYACSHIELSKNIYILNSGNSSMRGDSTMHSPDLVVDIGDHMEVEHVDESSTFPYQSELSTKEAFSSFLLQAQKM